MARNRSKCRRCHQPDSKVGHISRGGLCKDCATQAVLDNANAMRSQSGDTYQRYLSRWQEGMQNYTQRLSAQLDQEWREREQANAHRAN